MGTRRWGIVAPAVALAAGGAAIVMLTPRAHAAFPGHNGRIVFMRQDASHLWQLWVAGGRLDGQKRLTAGDANSGWPVWSPDGRLLAFDSDEADPDRQDGDAINDIYTIKPDGSGRTRITGGHATSSDAAWSPDGRHLAYASDQYGHPAKRAIYVMKADGSDPRKITIPPSWAANDLAPRFSPDGRRLVFTRYRGENAALFTVKLDGTALRRLTSFRIRAGDADWSPDGRQLVFEAYPTRTSRGEVFTVRPDGSSLRNLTHNGDRGGSADPVWSPDGRRILWLRAKSVGKDLRIGLAVMKPDGSSKHYLEAEPHESHQPDWESR